MFKNVKPIKQFVEEFRVKTIYKNAFAENRTVFTVFLVITQKQRDRRKKKITEKHHLFFATFKIQKLNKGIILKFFFLQITLFKLSCCDQHNY